jgi:hypothetical protein
MHLLAAYELVLGLTPENVSFVTECGDCTLGVVDVSIGNVHSEAVSIGATAAYVLRFWSDQFHASQEGYHALVAV